MGEAAQSKGQEKGIDLPRVTQLGGGKARKYPGAQTGLAQRQRAGGGAKAWTENLGPAYPSFLPKSKQAICSLGSFPPMGLFSSGPLHSLFPLPGIPFPKSLWLAHPCIEI